MIAASALHTLCRDVAEYCREYPPASCIPEVRKSVTCGVLHPCNWIGAAASLASTARTVGAHSLKQETAATRQPFPCVNEYCGVHSGGGTGFLGQFFQVHAFGGAARGEFGQLSGLDFHDEAIADEDGEFSALILVVPGFIGGKPAISVLRS